MAENGKSSARPATGDASGETKADAAGDATVSPATTNTVGDVRPAGREVPAAFEVTAAEAIDPRTGEKFAGNPGLGDSKSFDALAVPEGEASLLDTVPSVDPKRIPAEVTPGVSPDAGGDELLAAAQAKAPSLTREFVDAYDALTPEVLAGIARGEIPPPPTNGPIHTSDLHLTPGGWQSTPPGIAPGAVGNNAIAR